MRAYILAASAALILAGCNKTELADDAAVDPAVAPAAAIETPAAHDMSTMDADMAAADASDDTNTTETADGFTFHTYPAKTESVHLPAGNWTATATDGALVTVGAASDETMPDGATHHVVKVSTLASGNADVTFERRDTAEADGAVVETRTIHFMIH